MSTYRFLHMPSTTSWLRDLHQQRQIEISQHAVCLMALAHGALYLSSSDIDSLTVEERTILSPDVLYAAAMACLAQEQGPPTVESVQARLVQVHHLLASSRPTQAWYAFGTVIQLALSLGLHRSTSWNRQAHSKLALELRKRTFWSVYATDKYISITLGRPILLPDTLVSQDFPLDVSDEDLSDEDSHSTSVTGDSLTSATLCHIRLARIVTGGIEEQYEKGEKSLIESIFRNKARLEEWKNQLPLFLSGQLHPSTLVPTFRRQAVAMDTFYLHAVILINRPAMMLDLPPVSSTEEGLDFRASA